MKDKKSNDSRRKLLKSIAAGSGAVVAGKSLPGSWTRPVVDSVMLPAHAQTSCCEIAGQYCVDLPNIGFITITVSPNGSVHVLWDTGDPTYEATDITSCSGGDFDADFNTAAAPSSITGTISCGQTSISGDMIIGGTPTAYIASSLVCT